jgi:HK97 family phage prohead protease
MPKQTFDTPAADAKFEIVNRPNGLPMLVGYAIVFGVTSSDRGGYVVRFKPGSAVPADEVQALYCHDNSKIVGTTANGTLRLSPDQYGVKVEIDVPDTTTGRDVAELVINKYVRGMSFGLIDGDYTEVSENGQTIREFSRFIYDEVTITPIPAFVQTSIAAKYSQSHLAAVQAQRLRLLNL